MSIFTNQPSESSTSEPPTPTAKPRWNVKYSPLKVSYPAGHPDAPADVKAAVVSDPPLADFELCHKLTWHEAFVTLLRNPRSIYFHGEDYDWQICGFTLDRNQSPLSEAECKACPWLPANPTTADFVAEVMAQYSEDIDQLKEGHPDMYKTLKAGVLAWTDPAIATALVQWPLLNCALVQLDARKVFSRAYELDSSGTSVINPHEAQVILSEEESENILTTIRTTAHRVDLSPVNKST